MISFEVSDVEPGTLRLDQGSVTAAIRRRVKGGPPNSSYEAIPTDAGTVHGTGINPFVAAVALAFDNRT